MSNEPFRGWYLIAFQRELKTGITSAALGSRRLVLWSNGYQVRAFRGDCPHRGADLACGEFDGGAIRCAFHHYAIGLDQPGPEGFKAHEYPCFVFGGMVMVCLSGEDICDVRKVLPQEFSGLRVSPAVEMTVRTRSELVVENGFDSAHFKAVHQLNRIPELDLEPAELGQFAAKGKFFFPNPVKPDQEVAAEYRVEALSPGFGFTSLRNENSFFNYHVITGATPTRNHRPESPEVTLRVAFAFREKDLPQPWLEERFIQTTREGLELDKAIWEGVAHDAPTRWAGRDEILIGLHDFFANFEPASRRSSQTNAEPERASS